MNPVGFYDSLKLGEIGSAQEICETFIVTGSKQQVSAKVTCKIVCKPILMMCAVVSIAVLLKNKRMWRNQENAPDLGSGG